MNINQRTLLVFDLDGTLLSSEKTIMPKTKAILHELRERGHVIALASGRPPRAVIPYYEELGLDGPIISYNGACITDPKDNEFPTYHYFFKREWILSFLRQIKKDEIINLFAESGTALYLGHNSDQFDNMFHKEGMLVINGDYEKILNEDVYAFVFQMKNDEALKKLKEINLPDKTLFLRHWYDCDGIAEFGSTEVSKAAGIKRLEEIYKIPHGQTIAFGDAENDVEMLSYVASPFAMKNACGKLKYMVKNITEEDNDHEGIYLTLKRLFSL